MPDANDGLISQPTQAKMTPEELNEARRKFEAGQTTRRAALRKIGITAGAAFFAMFAVDDLARIAGKRLEQTHVDNKIADDLAKELRSVGVAFASGSLSSGSCGSFKLSPSVTNCKACNYDRYAYCVNATGRFACVLDYNDDTCLNDFNAGIKYCTTTSKPTHTGLNTIWSGPCGDGCFPSCP